MYNIRPTTKFQKDLNRVKKRGFDISFITQKGTSANPFSGQPMCFFLGLFCNAPLFMARRYGEKALGAWTFMCISAGCTIRGEALAAGKIFQSLNISLRFI